MQINITDADYQGLERELNQENLDLRRERAVFVRTINELRVSVARLTEERDRLLREIDPSAAEDEEDTDETDEAPAPKRRRRA